MIKFIKDYFWLIAGIVVVIGVTIFLRDMDRAEELKAFFRRKRVEEEVDEIKRKIAGEGASIEANETELVELAEKLKKDKVKVEDATDEEIKKYYEDLFSR